MDVYYWGRYIAGPTKTCYLTNLLRIKIDTDELHGLFTSEAFWSSFVRWFLDLSVRIFSWKDVTHASRTSRTSWLFGSIIDGNIDTSKINICLNDVSQCFLKGFIVMKQHLSQFNLARDCNCKAFQKTTAIYNLDTSLKM